MPKHILIATDGSILADKALVYALDLAKPLDAKVTVVTVSETWSPLDIANKVQAGHMKAVSEFEERAAEEAAKILKHATGIAHDKGVIVATHHIADALPADGILEAAQKDACDLIVMASHGRRGISKLVLGSQAHEVLSRSPVPVLICK